MGFIVKLSATLTALATLSRTADARAVDLAQKRQDGYHWVDTWTSMPQLVEQSNMPPAPFTSSTGVLQDATLRQTFHMSVGASKIRFVISNTFGGSALPITAASVGLPVRGAAGVSGIQASPLAAITVNGASSFTVSEGEVVTSDEIDFAIEAQSMITVTLFSQAGQSGSSITGHPGSRTTSWFADGNSVNATNFSGTSTAHWYFVDAVQAYVPTTSTSIIILGDSITDGRGSDTDKNDRWPDLVLARLQSSNYTNVAVNNQAAGGNAVLSGGLGPPLLTRYIRDAIDQPGVSWVMIFEGVNDIGSAANTASTQTSIGDQLIGAYVKIIGDAKKAGYVTIGATITPFGKNSYAGNAREATRLRVNEWILTNGTFDHAVDFASVVADPSEVSQLAAQYDSGDGLHPNVAGYQAIANSFPLGIFDS